MVIVIPQYNNRHLNSFALWIGDNLGLVSDYWHTLKEADEPLDASFVDFAHIQFEKERYKLG